MPTFSFREIVAKGTNDLLILHSRLGTVIGMPVVVLLAIVGVTRPIPMDTLVVMVVVPITMISSPG
jgi:hypothetical protein